MNQRTLGIVSIVVIVVLAVGAVLWVRFNPSRQLQTASHAPVIGKAQIGQTAPEFQAATTTGLFDLAKADKPVFLEVFATWCPHCQRETAVINQLYTAYHDKVDFVAVSGSDTGMDGTSPASQLDVLNFQQRFHVQYPLSYDPQMNVANLYLQGGFPTIVVIDKGKTVSFINSGEQTYADLEGALKKTL